MVLVNKYLAIVKENLQKKFKTINQSNLLVSEKKNSFYTNFLEFSVYNQIYQIKLKTCLYKIIGPIVSHLLVHT